MKDMLGCLRKKNYMEFSFYSKEKTGQWHYPIVCEPENLYAARLFVVGLIETVALPLILLAARGGLPNIIEPPDLNIAGNNISVWYMRTQNGSYISLQRLGRCSQGPRQGERSYDRYDLNVETIKTFHDRDTIQCGVPPYQNVP